jgi:hypothetical protein
VQESVRLGYGRWSLNDAGAAATPSDPVRTAGASATKGPSGRGEWAQAQHRSVDRVITVPRMSGPDGRVGRADRPPVTLGRLDGRPRPGGVTEQVADGA